MKIRFSFVKQMKIHGEHKMKVLYYDCFSGISGDMNLGALVDLGVSSAYLAEELSKLSIDSEYELSVKRAQKNGISGTKVDVLVKHEEHHQHRNLQDIAAIIHGCGLSDMVK